MKINQDIGIEIHKVQIEVDGLDESIYEAPDTAQYLRRKR
jgi:hypothetical protein